MATQDKRFEQFLGIEDHDVTKVTLDVKGGGEFRLAVRFDGFAKGDLVVTRDGFTCPAHGDNGDALAYWDMAAVLKVVGNFIDSGIVGELGRGRIRIL